MSELVSASVDLWQYVRALARSSLTVLVCCTELIDNSLDWEANHIVVEVSQGKHLRVTDNGRGVQDMAALVRFGGHVANVRRRGSGIYGVGFKDSCLRAGGETSVVRVVSVCDGRLTHATIDWQKLKQSDKCLELITRAADEPNGTSVEIAPLRLRFPEGKDRSDLVEQLAYVYAPALKRGAKILLRAAGSTVDLNKHRWKLPELTDVVDQRIEVGRKRARVRAGMVKDGYANTRPGLTYMHGYRVVKAASREGCGRHSVQRICGYVEVEDGWDRTKNKDDLVDAHDLYEAVEIAIAPLLAKADAAAHHLEIDEGLAAVECALSDYLDEATEKARRKRGEKAGTVEPKGTGRKHKAASETQPDGQLRPKKPTRCVTIDFEPGWKEGEAWGRYEVTTKLRAVTLFEDHPLIAQARSPFDATVILIAAMTLVSHGPSSGQLETPIPPYEILSRLATATSKLSTRLDGVPIRRAAE